MGSRAVQLDVMVGALCLLGAIAGHAQSVALSAPASPHMATVTIDVVRAPLADVLRAIARQSGLRTSWNDKNIDAAPRVSLHVHDVPVDVAFTTALMGTGLRAVMTADRVNFIDDGAEASMDGRITGRVIDAKTKMPLQGVMISLDDRTDGITSGPDGTFQMSHVVAGSHVLHVRRLGYTRVTKTVAIADGESVVVDVVLSSSVNTLEQVVVTGTVIPTELKAVPNAITIITGKELQDRGVTRIYELFRGDVPGLFVNRMGQLGAVGPGGIALVARGSTNLTGGGQFGVWAAQEGIKTYVDGVELADRSLLGMIDPSSIDRIEIITGPQASTIYGSNAINGVMQIFTKRGKSSRPQLTATLQSSWTQNSLSSALAPNHAADVDFSGVEGHVSYRAGGSWGYQGSWVPSVLGQTLGGSGGARVSMGPLTTDGSIRWSQVGNRSNGGDQTLVSVRDATGVGGDGTGTGEIPAKNFMRTTNHAVSLATTYAPIARWSHTINVGLDQSTAFSQRFNRAYFNPSDSDYALTQSPSRRVTAQYNTTVQIPMAAVTTMTVTVGVDESHFAGESFESHYLPGPGGQLLSTYPEGWRYRRSRAYDHGGFLQSQLGVWDALFVTYGLRAVYNPNLGKDKNPNWEPRYGAALSHEFGGITAKLRASYGTATRPPGLGAKDGSKEGYAGQNAMLYWGVPFNVLPNPDLVPESQQGGEGGLELYLGNRSSIQVTRYNQTVDHLIVKPVVDSVDVLPVWKQQYPSCALPFSCPLRRTQNLNLGSVRNQGWELRGSVNLGPFTSGGTYSWNKSRLIGITPRYRRQFPQYVVGATFASIPEHTWAAGITYVHGGTRIGYNLQGQGIVLAPQDATFLQTLGLDYRLNLNRPRMTVPPGYTEVYPGFPLGDLNASQQVTAHLELLLQMSNLTNSYKSDILPTVAQSGRQTGLGLRVQW